MAGMLAEPHWLRGHQERRLREFLELVNLQPLTVISQLASEVSPRNRLAQI